MIAKVPIAGVNQIHENIYFPRSVCPFVVQPKILNFAIWVRIPISISATVIVKKDCMLAIAWFSVPQFVLRRSGQNSFSVNAFKKNVL